MSASGVFCSQCGTRNEAGSLSCSNCGAGLAVAPPAPPPPAVPRPPLTSAYHPSSKQSNLPLFVALGFVFLLLLVVLIEGVIILVPRGAVQEVGATLSVLEGRAFVQRGGRGDWIEVAEEFAVQGGDRIRVADTSQALLTFVENTTTELRAFTQLTVAELQSVEGQPVVVRLDLQLGEIWNRIGELPAGSLHEVTTVAARAICQGSEYGMAANEAGTTWFTGREGMIDIIAAGQAVQLGPDDKLVVEPGSPAVPYREVAMAATSPVGEPAAPPMAPAPPPVTYTLESVDLPTFLNEPLPTGTPTNTPVATHTPTPTSTATPTPTATPTRISCPSLTINVPSNAYPRRAFGIEWDSTAPLPAGWEYALEFSGDQASWTRLPVPLDPYWYPEGGHLKAVIHGPGVEGTFYWRVCLVKAAQPTGPSECCGPPHAIIHSRPGHEEEEPAIVPPPEEPVFDD